MSLIAATIEDALYNWATTVTGLQVIWRFPNAPRPPLPYLDLNIASNDAIGWDFELAPNAVGVSALMGNRELVLEINYYGDGSMVAMEKLLTSLRIPSIRDTLAESGLYFVDKISEANITALVEEEFEERRIMELMFRYSNQGVNAPDEFDVGLIEAVEVTSEYAPPHEDLGTELLIGTPYEPPPEEPEEPEP